MTRAYRFLGLMVVLSAVWSWTPPLALTLKGSGETVARVTAEAANPKGDVWF
jgi:hypothetical protein